jgi:predicted nucleic acid-binding Zn finger protein
MIQKFSTRSVFNLTLGQHFTLNFFRSELIVATFLGKKNNYCAARNYFRCTCVFALAKSGKLGITPCGRQPNESEWRCPWTFV